MDRVDIPWIVEAELIKVSMPFVRPFITAHGAMTHRTAVLLKLTDQSDNVGWAECGADESPYYLPESPDTAWEALENIALPGFLSSGTMDEEAMASHPMARAAAMGALLDLTATRNRVGFVDLIGATRDRVEVGAVIASTASPESMLDEAASYVANGYRRLKLKIRPGFDVEPLAALRKAHPELALAVDANGSYSPSDHATLIALDQFGLSFIEQPFAAPDLEDHARLAISMDTPLCLDESLTDSESITAAIRLGATAMVTIKPGKLGGPDRAMEIAAFCEATGVPAWIGGLLETGIGRTHSLALAALPGCSLPADLSGSDRYYENDIVTPPWTLDDGHLIPTHQPTDQLIDREALGQYTVRNKTFERV